jgi:hypothetical protein
MQSGKFSYTSLVSLIKDGIKDEIWKIYTDQERVIFQSFSKIYIYENGKIAVLSGPGIYLFLHKVANRFFVESLGKGLFELKGRKLVPLINTGKVHIISYRYFHIKMENSSSALAKTVFTSMMGRNIPYLILLQMAY